MRNTIWLCICKSNPSLSFDSFVNVLTFSCLLNKDWPELWPDLEVWQQWRLEVWEVVVVVVGVVGIGVGEGETRDRCWDSVWSCRCYCCLHYYCSCGCCCGYCCCCRWCWRYRRHLLLQQWSSSPLQWRNNMGTRFFDSLWNNFLGKKN